MLETEGRINGEEQDGSQATGDLCSVWGVKEDAKGPNDSPLAKTRRAICTSHPPTHGEANWHTSFGALIPVCSALQRPQDI